MNNTPKIRFSIDRGSTFTDVYAEYGDNELRAILQGIKDQGFDSLAIVFMHSYAFPNHELIAGKIALELGFQQVSISCQIMPMIKVVARGDTTVVDAYLTPGIKNYVHSFQTGFAEPLPKGRLRFMQSHGGLSQANDFRGSNAILSGPAGGVVGCAITARQALGDRPIIGFDMGGTSTDVCRFSDQYELVHEREIAGVRIQAPQLNIHTVAAGGGSRLFFQNGIMRAGPESAGAHPGPLCYHKNGSLTITDANLLLGRLQAHFFPKIFGPHEDKALDRNGTERAFNALSHEINDYYQNSGQPAMETADVAAGFIEVANGTMARAIREISVMRGYDIKEHVLVSFGGAGGQHACAIARLLGMTDILIPRFAGILSALGMGLADVVAERQEPAALTFTQDKHSTLNTRLDRLEKAARLELTSQGIPDSSITAQRYLNMRFTGTDTNFMIPFAHDSNAAADFRAQHRQEFSFDLPEREIVIDDIRVRVNGQIKKGIRPIISRHQSGTGATKTVSCYFNRQWFNTPVWQLEEMGEQCKINGPALIISPTSTIVLEPDCHLIVNKFGDLEIKLKATAPTKMGLTDQQFDPVRLAVFGNLFMSIAEQMGRTLRRTATSTNIKERLDYSCAIFDHLGYLVANAPHIPVHLGAMSAAVQEQIKRLGADLMPGDVLMSNHPTTGGSHLPDITVITPIWRHNEIIFFTASRGHHADIGGLTPGSMPPFSTKLIEEGVCIESFKIVNKNTFQEEAIREIFQESRRINDNIADLKAQVAANQRGIDLLLEMVDNYGLETVQAYMGHIQDCAERRETRPGPFWP